MLVIDPLKIKIRELLSNGSDRPIYDANNGFISQCEGENIFNLFKQLSIDKNDFRRYIYIDTTPYQRFVNISDFIKLFSNPHDIRPVLLINDKLKWEINRLFGNNCPVCYLNFNAERELLETHCPNQTYDLNNLHYIKTDFSMKNGKKKGGKYFYQDFRKEYANHLLTDILYKSNCIEIPAEFTYQAPMTKMAGRYYFSMVNGMLVSCYLNLKMIGNNNSHLVDIAYEVIMELMCYFSETNNSILDDFDFIVTPNNTALFLASTIQAIIHKPIVSIDKLGPIPSLKIRSKSLKNSLYKKKVILLEEVMATGSEIDRSIMFLNSVEADIKKVIGIYNLDIGSPLLIKKDVVSLCRPKEEINYVYRSK